MGAKDIEGVELKRGDRVVLPFEVIGTHGDGVALLPVDPSGAKQPVVTFESRLCKKSEMQPGASEPDA